MNCAFWSFILVFPFVCAVLDLDFNTFIVGEKSYFIPRLESSYSDASSWCLKFPGRHLVAIESPEEGEAILRAVKKTIYSFKSFWTSGIASDTHYAWYNQRIFNYSNWAPGKPDNATTLETCVLMQNNGKWANKDCTLSFPFICEYLKVKRTEVCKCTAKRKNLVGCGNVTPLIENIMGKTLGTVKNITNGMSKPCPSNKPPIPCPTCQTCPEIPQHPSVQPGGGSRSTTRPMPTGFPGRRGGAETYMDNPWAYNFEGN